MAPINATDGQGNPQPDAVQVAGHAGATRATTEMPPPADRPTIRVRARNDFFTGGELRRTGEEFDMDVDKARHAAMFLEVITPDGKQIAVEQAIRNMLGESTVGRADIAGRPAHERVQALENEEQALKSRLDVVTRQLELERGRLQADQDRQQQRQQEIDARQQQKDAQRQQQQPPANAAHAEHEAKPAVEGSSK